MLKGLFLVIGIFLSWNSLEAQTFLLQPAQAANNNGDFGTKLLLKKDKVFRVTWSQLTNESLNLSGKNAKLVIGRSSNSYKVLDLNVSGTSSDFIPNNVSLGAGRYYARVTNSTKRTASGIQADFDANPNSIIYSNEILIIVEANEAPAIIAPRGRISNSSPTFQWSSVTGVPSYWLIVSSTPFDIVEDEGGNISIEGATIVWQYITKSTTAEYGAINRDSPFLEEAPPLNADQEYSYTVLNVYEDNNPGFTSPVFGGIVPFIYDDPNAVPAVNLISPVADEVFFSQESITFNWSKVSKATNYTINLLQIVKQQGINVTIPIWTSTSTNTSIEYPAIENLKNGFYQWNVISNNSSGGGTTSGSRFFEYKVETGEFAARIISSSDNSSLLGVELSARAISGGVTPSIPFFVQSGTHFDSLVAGTYEFIALKDGYAEAKTNVTIEKAKTRNFTLPMTPLPSSIKGTVLDENDNAVEDASVRIKNVSSGVSNTVRTNISGEFDVALSQGSYSILVSKSGYLSSQERTVNLAVNEQKEVATPFKIVNDQATVSGVVFNEQGEVVQRANVTIIDNTESYETKTNGSGQFQFTVSSGNWNLSVQKTGFVKPSDKSISLSTGDVLQGQNFILTGNANQVTGFVRERITNADGTTSLAPFKDIEVRAVPNVGTTITTRTSNNGQYSLSLKSGSYTILSTKTSYSSNQERELVIGIAVGETISGMDFELIPNPSSISGTVLLSNGTGVEGATVTVLNSGTTLTNSSGYYKLSVPQGNHTLSISKTGLVSPEPKKVSVNAGQNLTGVSFEMTPNAGSISGKVTSGGEALSNTTLTAINNSTGKKVEILNSLNGTYTFNLKSGSWYIKAEKPGFISDSTSLLTIGAGQQLVNKNFSLVKNLTTVRGTITDGINPVKNATISVTRSSGSAFNQSTVSQLNGTYAFSLPAGSSYIITVQKDGFKSTSRTSDNLIPETTELEDFSISANPSSIAGTVSIVGSSVLSGAKIVALDDDSKRIDSTLSKTSGTYLLGLNPGTYTIEVTKPGYSKGSKISTVSVGQNLTGINFNVSENFAFLTGSVKGSDDTELEQAFINVTRQSGTGASAVSEQDGSFTISGLVGGVYSIQISKSGFVSKSTSKTLKDGDFVTIAETLIPKNGSIRGQVRDENGGAISEATVTATHTNGTEYTSISDVNGDYSITALELGDYSVNASKTGYNSQLGTSITISEIDLNRTGVNVFDLIANNAVVTGTITNKSTGSTIKEVEVSISGDQGSGSGITNSNGVYSISNLSPGTYPLVASKDGFRNGNDEVTLSSGESTTSNIELTPNNGKITGIVTDSNGDVLPFRVTVLAFTDGTSLTTQTDGNGAFTFEEIETGLEYIIQTDIYRDGYENVEATLAVPEGAEETSLTNPLKVIVRRSSISGNVGVQSATVSLLNASTDEIIDLQTSALDGSFSFEFIARGVYIVVPQRLGYTFSPETSRELTLGTETEEIISFTATANIATLDVQTKNVNGNPISNTDVTIISSDTTIILSSATNQAGIARFRQIQASTTYLVRVSKDGFTANPVSKEIELNSGDSVSTSFELISNSSSINGVVKASTNGTESNLREANVTAVFLTTGESFETETSNSGAYTFENLAPGGYNLIASKEGYGVDTLSVELTAGENITAEDIVLISASVEVRGFVKLKSVGVEEVTVTALSTSSLSTLTNSSGLFRFQNLTVKTGENDTTIYQINVTEGVFTKSYTLAITADQVGTRITLPQTNLPSGRIGLTILDGVEPVSGAIVNFGISGGESETEITGEDGMFTSSENLRKATYTVGVAKEGFLFPQNSVRLELESDTTILEEDILLPYTLEPVGDILADQDTRIDVVNREGYDNSSATGVLFFKRKSESQFNQQVMTQIGDTLRGNIPEAGSIEEVTFYTSINDVLQNNTFVSSQESKTPLASGILSNIRVSPTISGQSLRVGETYNLSLFVRDGINKSLVERFEGETPEGAITWTVLGESGGISLTDQKETTITLSTLLSGSYQIQVEANLEGSIISNVIDIEVTNIPIEEITVSIPAKKVPNSSASLFSYSAIDTSGGSIILGESLEWVVSPSSAGSIDKRGVFEPSSTSILGSFNITVKDVVSGKTGTSEPVELIARIEPDESYLLTDVTGLELSLPIGSVDITSQLSIGETTPPSTKKFVFAQGTDVSYTVSDKIYILSFSGSDLKKAAELILPEDSSLALNEGERRIARFNFTTLQWEVLQTSASKSRSSLAPPDAVSIEELGQFAVLAENEPLAIKYAAVLPSPFSPDIAPVKIGYWLDSAFPPAKVDIKIFNIKGKLVRTILEDVLQQPGRYGSSSSTKEITWDGLTDEGTMARNGRYVIQIKAKDQQQEEVKLLQVVLIK